MNLLQKEKSIDESLQKSRRQTTMYGEKHKTPQWLRVSHLSHPGIGPWTGKVITRIMYHSSQKKEKKHL